MVSPNDKWVNRTEYRLLTHVVRVTEQREWVVKLLVYVTRSRWFASRPSE